MSKEQVVKEIHRPARRNFQRRSVILKGINDLWQADLMDMKSLKKYNNGYAYILTIIDCFTKFAWALPLKTKSKQEVVERFNIIIQTSGPPNNLQTDRGTEFYNKPFQELMDKLGINHYSTYSTKKASIVERLIRTLKNKLHASFSYNGNYKWVGKCLENVLHSYNNTTHSITKYRPVDVNTDSENIVKYNIIKFNNKRTKLSKKNFKIGDSVRISKYKSSFDKGYTPNWSTEIFTINAVNKTAPVTYHIQDQRQQPISGSFYQEELQKTNNPNVYLIEKVIRKKGDKLFVKWLGLSNRENSWVNKSSIVY